MTPVDWPVTIATQPLHRVVCCYSKIATTANENSPDELTPKPYSKTLKESDWSHAKTNHPRSRNLQNVVTFFKCK